MIFLIPALCCLFAMFVLGVRDLIHFQQHGRPHPPNLTWALRILPFYALFMILGMITS